MDNRKLKIARLVFVLTIFISWGVLSALLANEIGTGTYWEYLCIGLTVCVAIVFALTRHLRPWARIFYPSLLGAFLILHFLEVPQSHPSLGWGLGLIGLLLGPFADSEVDTIPVKRPNSKKMTEV